jgi:predicted HTH transcriptional regulator
MNLASPRRRRPPKRGTLDEKRIVNDRTALMECHELIEMVRKGEDSFRQFKEKVDSIDKLAVELSAFANSEGGCLVVGVTDRGELAGIDREEAGRLNQWIANAASSKIEPPLFVRTEILICEEKRLLIVHVPRGPHKPYAVNKMEFWVKNGADKRRATREELFRLMQSSRLLFADEIETDADLTRFDQKYFDWFCARYYKEPIEGFEIEKVRLLKNLKLMGESNLSLAGLLLFGKDPGLFYPYFSIRATYYEGTDKSVVVFRDKEEIGGKLIDQFTTAVAFVKRNLHRLQKSGDFNAPGELEIPAVAFSEAISNAIVHRDYFVHSPIFVDLFVDRLEITSPGALPNTLNEENIRYGVHIERNPTILSMLERDRDFKYSGRGSGIPRMIKSCREAGVDLHFFNDRELQVFKAKFARPEKADIAARPAP